MRPADDFSYAQLSNSRGNIYSLCGIFRKICVKESRTVVLAVYYEKCYKFFTKMYKNHRERPKWVALRHRRGYNPVFDS